MAQPEYVPIIGRNRVRGASPMPPAEAWHAVRPGDLEGPGQPSGTRLGHQATDAGYGLKLARHFVDRLQLTGGESVEDAVAGAFGVGLMRASFYSRAPMVHDMEFAYTLFGFLGGAPADLIEFRRGMFAGAGHDYWEQRDIVDLVPDAVLRLRPAQVRERLAHWQELLAGRA